MRYSERSSRRLRYMIALRLREEVTADRPPRSNECFRRSRRTHRGRKRSGLLPSGSAQLGQELPERGHARLALAPTRTIIASGGIACNVSVARLRIFRIGHFREPRHGPDVNQSSPRASCNLL